MTGTLTDNLEAEKAEVDSMVFDTPSDYEIVRIDSFDQASEYGEYTSWCVTHNENMFDSYTSNGINQFYFCLKHGFEDVKRRTSEGCPLDEYGLSMIAVSVNENGMLNTCTCRWNHDNGGDDSVMNAKELSQVIGMNFFKVFKPNNKWKSVLSDAIQRLKNGESPDSVFDNRYNFHEGFAIVELNGRYNFIDKQDNILSSQWFDWCTDFHEGFAIVELNGRYNFIDKQDNILSSQWFDLCSNFNEGLARVRLNNRYNFIDKQCNLLSSQWFDWCDSFNDGFAAVELNGRMNSIDKQGNYLSDQWFDYCWNFYEGFAKVRLNGKYNFIDKQCNYLSDQWFDVCYSFNGGFAKVKLNGKSYKIDTNGRLHESKGNNKPMITESQESKSISQAKRLVMQRLNYNEQEADEFIRVKLRNDIPVLRTPSGGKFILGAARMFCDGELRTANDIGNLNSTLKLVASDAHINEYDRNLNGMSFQDLVQRFAKADNLEAEKAEVDSMVFDTPSDYEIVRIDSFDQASEYGEYTDWCVAHFERMFDSYTSDGINQFYFCLKHGFEGVERQASEGCPLDEYGLSMIAVSVNENGMLNTCTCRWNHDNGGDDNVMNTKELSQVIGMNFFEVFKPNNKWKSLVNDVIQRLKNGESPDSVFNICWSFHDGFAIVGLDCRYNYIDEQCNILSSQWFDNCHNFYEGFARVELNDRWNHIDKQGNIISRQWFDYCWSFDEGFARVYLNDKYNFIDKQGNLLSDQWFDNCGDFHDGFAAIKLNDRMNFIDEQGNYLSDQWFYWCGDFSEGFATVRLNGKRYKIDTNGRLHEGKGSNKPMWKTS